MTKVATYDDLLAEIEAQQAYIAQLEQEREALQKELAELRYVDVSKIMPNQPTTKAARVPLVEGWYGAYGGQPVAWVATDEDADKLLRQENIDEVGRISMLRHKGYDLSPFISLREAYYAAQ